MKPTPTTDAGNGMVAPLSEPDAHGQAALMLVESMLHALVENKMLSAAQAAGAARTAVEVKRETAMMLGESRERMQQSITLLEKIETSFGAGEE